MLADGHDSLTPQQLREFAQGELAHYKVPRYVQVIEEFPMTVTGKVRKVDLRARAMDLLESAG